MKERDILQQRYQQRIDITPTSDRQRLANARRSALAQSNHRSSLTALGRWSWIPAGAAASLMVLLLWPGEPGEQDATVDTVQAEVAVDDLDILLAEEDLDFYAELDFYLWLEEEMDETS
ncbi:hypothetical protein J2T60_001746 [Natronospira proteinivora]|uniref:DUF3619 family protein n=1 Tax=Natronospira proteinivora TaxID=1807133 RepID=A0ABT1G8V4_9GAMM|nr:hypothetical protein [Natronospira proteinivora]MCP1727746.1 hypothetical protein [Natronospira proteinivora]